MYFFFNFQDLLNKIQCRSIQFRDHAITESNEDSKYDKMGSFYGNIIDLSAEIIQNSPEIQAPSANMNETVVLENRTADETIGIGDKSDLILTILNDPTEAGNDSEEEEEEEFNSPAAFRPPTPPKVSPKNSPKNSVLPDIQSNSFTTASKGNPMFLIHFSNSKVKVWIF